MKLSAAAFTLFLCVGSTTAQYFSVGWSPGQKASSDKPPAKAFAPPQASPSQTAAAAAAKNPSPSFPNSLMDKLLTFSPVSALLSSLGMNVSAALSVKLWDERIQLITDDNYQDLIVNEQLTPKEEKERAWVLIITGQTAKQDDVSKLADNVFDTAYEQAQQTGDLPHIRWGRIDYLNVTRITTKWVVWQVPYIVIITDRGQTLRFYRHYQVRLRAENLSEFLKTKGYLLTPPWTSAYAPGGEREYILDHFANIITKIYNFAVLFPRWLFVVASGAIASFIIALMHRSSIKAANLPKPKPNPVPSVISTEKKSSPPSAPVSDPVPVPVPTVPAATTNTQPNGASSSKPTSKAAASETSNRLRSASPPNPLSKNLTPVATDSERESTAKPTKRSTRPKKAKRT